MTTNNIFLSYNKADEEIAGRVRGEFERAGLTVWTMRDIETGDPWMEKIDQTIQESDCVVSIMSPDSRDSDWCRIERARARAMGKTVFPILVKGDLLSAVPIDLTETQYTDLRPKKDEVVSPLPRLVTILQKRFGVTPPLPQLDISPSSPQKSSARSKTIFVSSPLDRSLSAEQRAIKKYLIDLLVRQNFKPLLIGEVGEGLNMPWTFDGVMEVIRDCGGAIMLGLARWNCADENGYLRFATEYTHFEGALALAYELPTLIIKEYDVSERGIFYTGGGRFIITLPPTNAEEWLASEEFQQRFEVWREAAQARLER